MLKAEIDSATIFSTNKKKAQLHRACQESEPVTNAIAAMGEDDWFRKMNATPANEFAKTCLSYFRAAAKEDQLIARFNEQFSTDYYCIKTTEMCDKNRIVSYRMPSVETSMEILLTAAKTIESETTAANLLE